MKITVEILSPEGQVYQGEADEVIAPTQQGEIAILPNHSALFARLAEGEIIIKDGKNEISIAVTGGFLEISKNNINILADYAIRAENIEIAKAEQAKKKAEELLREKKENFDFSMIEKDLQRSILELKIGEKVRRKNRPS